jgi:DNA mismatch repair protein MutS2
VDHEVEIQPAPLFEDARVVLEFEQVRGLVARYIGGSLGAAELAKVSPSIDRTAIEAALAEAGEATQYLRAAAAPQIAGQGAAIRINLKGLADVTISIQKLHIEGAALEPREIFDLIGFLDRAADVASFLSAAGERFPRLAARAQGIGDFRPLLKEVEGKIQGDGTVLDSASPHLNRLRKDIEKQKKAIQDSLERFLRVNRGEGILQEEYITLRNDRFVVPVVAGQRRKLPGVIHGASSTGQTLFLEPLETIDLNNELVRQQEEESREVFRILRELTSRLRVYSESIRAAAEIIGALDLIFAKARFAIDFDCSIPRFAERLHFENARHPLLMDVLRRNHKRVVPFTLTLNRDCRTFLISGPNTGGKTVTLKTVGLIALMAQSALPVPCSTAELPVFEQILADIGDNQSIEQNLSTFSAHVSHLREMALDATPDSLVLLDEIGSATDPEEGGALGVALVDHFRAAGAMTLASTHLTALKIYGANTKTVLNASMGFDEQTLEPTYQLLAGLPGKSAGLDIAARLGMPEDIMKRARASLSTQEVELSTLIANLHKRLEESRLLEAALEQQRAALVQREQQIRQDAERREAAKLRELEERFDEMQRRWQERGDEVMARIAETTERRKAVDEAHRQTARVKREMREEWESIGTQSGQSANRKLNIAEGTHVRLKGIREPARVRRLMGNDRFEVEAGLMKMQVSMGDIEEVLPEASGPSASKLPKNVRYQPGPEFSPSVQELNLIGEREAEAVERVERFLDAAVMATAARVRIVHGHGMGILKRAVQDVLKRSPHVEKFYPASSYEGGAGATIAELRE